MLPLYVATVVATQAAAGSISVTTAQPAFELALHLSLLFAVTAGMLGRSRRWSPEAIGAVVMLGAFTAFALRQSVQLPLVGLLYPREVVEDEEIGLATLVAWLMVGLGYLQGRRENFIFVFAAGLASISLMGTRNLNPELLGCFFTFMLAAVFCWGYSHFLDAAESCGRPLDWRDWTRAHLSGAVLVFALASCAGGALGNALYSVTPRLFTGFGFQPRVINWAGAQVGGYFLSVNRFGLGEGPIRLSPDPVVKVRAAAPTLLYGRSYDVYEGSRWNGNGVSTARRLQYLGNRSFNLRAVAPVRTPSGASATPVRVGAEDAGPPRAPTAAEAGERLWGKEPLRGKMVRQELELMGPSTTSIFAPPYPSRLTFGPAVGPVDVAHPSGLSTDRNGAIHTATVMMPGQTYTVWSMVPEFPADRLRNAPAPDYSREFEQQYVKQMSLEVSERLEPLVRQITQGLTNNYDKAVAIQRYLEAECLYTLDVPRTPDGVDAVVYFVTVSRRGACDLFASAMTLMCRLAGIPARIATGFAPGTWDATQQAFIVRGLDAHAWSEVYFPGSGWVTFDLSAQRSLERETWLSLIRSGYWRVVLDRFGRVAGLALMGLILLYVMVTALTDPLRPVRTALARWRMRHDPVARVVSEYLSLTHLLARRACVRPSAAWTPREVLAQVQARRPSWPRPLLGELEALTAQVYALRYGGEPNPRGIGVLRRQIASLRKSVRRLTRRH
jgi:transglutaminase-like putative cysteine protease